MTRSGGRIARSPKPVIASGLPAHAVSVIGPEPTCRESLACRRSKTEQTKDLAAQTSALPMADHEHRLFDFDLPCS